ncbi:MAG: HAD-IIB family hydrolase [Clostridia bacterium]
MKKFEGIYLFSDIDGTLSSEKNNIPEKNLNAINYFIENGGTFSVATGRYFGDLDVLANIPINGLCILNNGASVYDYQNDKELFSLKMTDKTADIIIDYCQKSDDLGLVVINKNGYTTAIIDEKNRPIFHDRYPVDKIENLKKPYHKLLIVVNNQNAKRVLLDLEKMNLTDASFVRTGEFSIEVLANNVSKGNAFLKICEMKNIENNKTFFVGDSFNDTELMRVAGFSGCVCESDPEVQKCADTVMCSFSEGIVAKMVEHIESIL